MNANEEEEEEEEEAEEGEEEDSVRTYERTVFLCLLSNGRRSIVVKMISIFIFFSYLLFINFDRITNLTNFSVNQTVMFCKNFTFTCLFAQLHFIVATSIDTIVIFFRISVATEWQKCVL